MLELSRCRLTATWLPILSIASFIKQTQIVGMYGFYIRNRGCDLGIDLMYLGTWTLADRPWLGHQTCISRVIRWGGQAYGGFFERADRFRINLCATLRSGLKSAFSLLADQKIISIRN